MGKNSELKVESSGRNKLSTLNAQPSTHLARLELGVNEIPKLLEGDTFSQVAEQLKRLGYAHVTLDLAGYRRGSMNETPIRFGAPKSDVGSNNVH